MLVGELKSLGLADAVQTEFGIVMATLPATRPGAACTVAFNSHLDTSPETTGAGVRPQVIRNYRGGDLVLPGDPRKVIREADNPDLATCLGRTLITTDGTTLLGADDKAGVAVIMETGAYLAEHHGNSARPGENSASPAMRKSATGSIMSDLAAARVPRSVTRSTGKEPTRSTWKPSLPIWPPCASTASTSIRRSAWGGWSTPCASPRDSLNCCPATIVRRKLPPTGKASCIRITSTAAWPK